MSVLKELKDSDIFSGALSYHIGVIGSDPVRVSEWLDILCNGEHVIMRTSMTILFANSTFIQVFNKEDSIYYKKFDIAVCDICSDPELVKTVATRTVNCEEQFIDFEADIAEYKEERLS